MAFGIRRPVHDSRVRQDLYRETACKRIISLKITRAARRSQPLITYLQQAAGHELARNYQHTTRNSYTRPTSSPYHLRRGAYLYMTAESVWVCTGGRLAERQLTQRSTKQQDALDQSAPTTQTAVQHILKLIHTCHTRPILRHESRAEFTIGTTKLVLPIW